MDIASNSYGPAKQLSNFTGHGFIFDGVECASMEGFLQSLKFDKQHIQEEVCKLVGFAAKRRGYPKNKQWHKTQTLWWKGIPYDRHGKAYQTLLNRAYQAMFDQNLSFRSSLCSTGSAVLKHSIGKTNPHDTILTEAEFCSRLTKLRDYHTLEDD